MPETERALVGPRWVHWWAVLTVLVTLPLLLLGAEVTTKQVGMIDPDWPTPPWQMWLTSWRRDVAYLVEHSHRLAGYTVGTCGIVLVAGLWLCEPRRWLRWLGAAALLGIIGQGLLGGFRVRLNAILGTDLAMIHGIFGQIVFALLASVALCTSRRWGESMETWSPEDTLLLRRWSLLLTGVVLLQLFLGAALRHRGLAIAQRLHLLVAFGVVASAVWFARQAWESPASDRRLLGMVKVLGVLIAVQLLLGVEAWMVKFSSPELAAQPAILGRDLVRSAHVLVGSLILATSVGLTLESHRRTGWVTESTPAPASRLEGAA
ncbi:MAG: COX15/CtaA family protein [Gemmataceae bacterium]|nr:COX15/CtaA family protein [Gemmataceae bacterium]